MTLFARAPGPLPRSSACWERWPSFTLWPVRSLPGRQRPHAGERVDERRLAGAVGPDERHVLAALEVDLRIVEQHPRRVRADLDAPADELEDDAPGALGRLEVELQPLAVARVALDALDLVRGA